MTEESARAGARSPRISGSDVATAAGVSRTTVSYVLNGRQDVRIPDETRNRVLEVAAQLGYAPSASARTLRTGSNRLVLLLLPAWAADSPGVTRLATALTSGLAAHRLSLIQRIVHDDQTDLRELWTEVAPVAVTSLVPLDDDVVAKMRAAGVGVQTVIFDRPAEAAHEHESPEIQIGRLQVRHLADRDHRRIGYAMPAPDPMMAGFAIGRAEGVRAECSDHGFPPPVVVEIDDPESTLGAVRRWTSSGVTAVCAFNDDYAIGVLTAALTLGIAVPGDLAVIGVDDTNASRRCVPSLTTVVYDFEALGEFAARYLADEIAGHPRGDELAPESQVRLIPRQST